MHYSILKITGLMIIAVLMSVSVSHSEKRYDEQGDEVVYGAKYHEGLYDGYFTGEDGVTTISIDDIAYLLAPDGLLRDENARQISAEQLEVGSFVKFFEVEKSITKLWAAADQDRQGENLSNRQNQVERSDSPDSAVSPARQEGELRLENGVWTN